MKILYIPGTGGDEKAPAHVVGVLWLKIIGEERVNRKHLWVTLALLICVAVPNHALAQGGKAALDIDFQGWNQALSNSEDARFLKPAATNFGLGIGFHIFSAGSAGFCYQKLPLDSSGTESIWAGSGFAELNLSKANRVQPFFRTTLGAFGQSGDSDFGFVYSVGGGLNVYFGEHFAIRPVFEYNGRLSEATSFEDRFGPTARLGVRFIF